MASTFLDELIANRFAKLAGLQISGTIPLPDDLVNDALAELVQGWSQPEKTAKPAAVPVADILAVIRKLQVRTESGTIRLDFEIGV